MPVTPGKLWQEAPRIAAGAGGQPGGQMTLVIPRSPCPEGSAGEATAETDPLLQPLLGGPLKHHP